jgi:hypothetical protein
MLSAALALATGTVQAQPTLILVDPLVRDCTLDRTVDGLGMETGWASCPEGETKVVVLGEGAAYREVHTDDGGGYTQLYRWVGVDWQQIADSRNP